MERSKPQDPQPPKQKHPEPAKQVTPNPSTPGKQPKNTPLGRNEPDSHLLRR
jgi:hypothetical protein